MALKPIVLPLTYKSDPKGLKQAEDQLKGFAAGIGKIAAGATAAVAGIAAVSIKAFADFDSKLNQSLAIMGDVSEAMRKDMSDAAREVAKTTTFSANEAAESYFFLASAGLDAAQSIAAMPAVANFAQAGMFDMALATDLLTDAQSALGLGSEDATENLENMARISDVLVKANTLANASVEQFASALTNKSAVAMRAMGMEVEEGVAILSVFADAGVKGEEAGTRLNATLIGLTTTARTNASAYNALGIEIFNAEGEMNDMATVVGQMEKAFDGMSTEQKLAELAALGFNRQARDGILLLLGQSEALAEYETALESAGGTTDEVAGKQLDTLQAQFELLKSEIVDVGIALGSELEPAFKDLVTDLKPVIGEIGDALLPAFQSIMPVIKTLVAFVPTLIKAFLPLLPTMVNIAGSVFKLAEELLPLFIAVLDVLLPIIESFTAFLVNNSEIVNTLVVGIGAAVMIVKTWNTVIGIAKMVMLTFNAVLAANPIGFVITAVVALTAALVYFFTQTELGRVLWGKFTTFVTETATAIAEWFSYIFSEWIPGLWTSFVEFLSEGWQGFRDGFMEVLEGIGLFFKNMINGYISMWESFINFFLSGINSIIRGINKLQFTIPGIGDNPGVTVGFNLPTIPNLALPRLAEGGIIKKQPGGIIANIGEGRYDEAVIPLDGRNRFGSTYNITVNAGMGTDGGRVGEMIVKEIKRFERLSGPVFAGA
jgi:TP901 family phage tail tape measure protein